MLDLYRNGVYVEGAGAAISVACQSCVVGIVILSYETAAGTLIMVMFCILLVVIIIYCDYQ